MAFPFVAFAELQEMVFTVMKKCKNIPVSYLQRFRFIFQLFFSITNRKRVCFFKYSLSAAPQLYDVCPIEVKRQIWLADADVFRREVFNNSRLWFFTLIIFRFFAIQIFPLLTEFIAETNPREPLYDLLHNETTPPPVARRKQVCF